MKNHNLEIVHDNVDRAANVRRAMQEQIHDRADYEAQGQGAVQVHLAAGPRRMVSLAVRCARH